MSRYRKVKVKIWGDEKFRALSAAPPNAQTLFFYLITGPHTVGLPGASHVGEAALAEGLGWPLKAFRKAFTEVSTKGMAKADWEARLVFVPRAVEHNPPENPNVVTAWGRAFGELPECDLKREVFQHVKDFIKGFDKTLKKVFVKAFVKAFGDTLALALALTLTEVSTTTLAHPNPARRSANRITDPPEPGVRQVLDAYHVAFMSQNSGEKPNITGKDAALARQLVKRHGAEKVLAVLRLMFESVDPFIAQSGRTMGVLSSQWNKLVVGQKPRQTINERWKDQPAGEVKL